MRPDRMFIFSGYCMTKRYRYIYRDAKTGRLVTEAYALTHPGTTVRERVEY